jgi:hypothetical protein
MIGGLVKISATAGVSLVVSSRMPELTNAAPPATGEKKNPDSDFLTRPGKKTPPIRRGRSLTGE